MKKKTLILFLTIFTIYFININKVDASSISITCNKTTLAVDETASCTVKGTVDEPFNGVTAKLSSNSNLEISNITKMIEMQGEADSLYYWTASTFSAGTYDIASFTVKGLNAGNGVISLRKPDGDEVVGYDEELGFLDSTGDGTIVVPDVDYPITVTGGGSETLSDDSSLSNLVPSVGQLDPAFSSNGFLYDMSIDFRNAGSVTFAATRHESHQNITGTTCAIPNSTSVQSVVCNIVVTAQNGTSKSTYKVTVTNTAYEEETPPSTVISGITSDDGVLSPAFSKNVLKYEMSVNFLNTDKVNFKVSLEGGGTAINTCDIPKSSTIESVVCSIGKYTITVKNTNKSGETCDLVISSSVYTIDQTNRVIKVNKDHSLETIKSNLSSTCGEITVGDKKVVITDGINSREYTIERLVMPQTGNQKILYSAIIIGVISIIAIGWALIKIFNKKNS